MENIGLLFCRKQQKYKNRQTSWNVCRAHYTLLAFHYLCGALNQSPSAVIFFISSRAHVRLLIFFLPVCTWVEGIHSVCLLAGWWLSLIQDSAPASVWSRELRRTIKHVSDTDTKAPLRSTNILAAFHPPLPKYNHTPPPWRCTEELKRSTPFRVCLARPLRQSPN